LKGHSSTVSSVCFSPDGKRLASASGVWDGETKRYSSGEVKVWDGETGQEALSLKGHTANVFCVCFSPDGKRLASGGGGCISVGQKHDFFGELKLWDAKTGQETLSLKGHSRLVYAVCFSPDGNRLASASGDHFVKVWDAENGQALRSIHNPGHVLSVCFSPDGGSLAGASDDRSVKVWDLPASKPAQKPLGQDKQPEPLPEAVVKAWTEAGAQSGWIRQGPFDFAQFIAGSPALRPGDVPGFRFATWRPGVVAKLPPPQQPFGLDFRFAKGLSDEAVKELAGLGELQSLNLEYTDVTAGCAKELAGLKGLKRLNLGHVKSGAGLKEVLQLKQLQALNIWHSGQTDADVKEVVAALPGLQMLDVSASPGRVTDACVKGLAGLKELTSLNIRYTSLTDAGLKELAGLKRLRALSIGVSKVTDAGLKELAVLKELETLHVDRAQVTDAGLKELVGLKEMAGLKGLDLTGTKVTDAGLKELAALKELQTLDLRNTQVTDEGLKELRKALPKCAIVK
jgi:Leucine-rich repeat (LRR) protein